MIPARRQNIRYSASSYYISRFFENQPNEICSHLCEKASKGRFPKTEKLQNHSNEGKGKEKKKGARRRKGGEEKKKKQWFHSLNFYNSYFGDSFWPTKLLDAKRPKLIGENVFKNNAYIYIYIYIYIADRVKGGK